MPKMAPEKTALEVRHFKKAGLHAAGGVAGLHLQITANGAKSWILRVRVGSKRRDIGLGGYPSVTLAQSREKARLIRGQIEEGIDPVQERQAAKARLIASQTSTLTFDEAVREFMRNKSQELNPKLAAGWLSTLDTYASPVLGRMVVGDIELSHILAVLEPIWTEKTETAKRLRGRVEAVLAWAIVRGLP